MKNLLLSFCFLLSLSLLYGNSFSEIERTLADGDLTSLVISDDADNVIITVQGTLTTNYNILINMDNNGNTGLFDSDWIDSGADYLVQNGALYRYAGLIGAWGWSSLGVVSVSEPSGTERIISIPKSLITTPSLSVGSTILVGYKSVVDPDVTDFLPDTPGMQSYTIANSPTMATSSITTTRDATNLYITISSTTLAASWGLYIDADGSSSTGFYSWPFPTSSGAEYLIEQGGGGNVFTGADGAADWLWDWVGGATVVQITSEIVVTVPLASFAIGSNFSVGYVGSSFIPANGSFQPQISYNNIWNGSEWDNGAPTASDDARVDANYNAGTLTTANLTVNTGATLTISSGETLTVNGNLVLEGSLLIESGGSLITFDANSISGNAITFERTTRYDDGRYSFVGSPVLQYPTITGSDLGTDVYKYDEKIDFSTQDGVLRWIDASLDQLIPGVGYTQANQLGLTFSGTPNTGDITVSGLTHTAAAAANATDRGWNLVSNPYPAAIDVTDFIFDNQNIEGSIALWDDHGSGSGRGDNNDYLIANDIGDTGPNNGVYNGLIGSAQGFLVQVSAEAADASIIFKETQREAGDNEDAYFFRKSEENNASIKLALNGDFYNEILIGFREDATFGHDRLYDARKLSGNSKISFYSYIDDSKYAIQGLPLLTKDLSVSLGYDLSEAGVYNLEIVDSNNLPDGYDVIVVNTATGKAYNLTLDGSAELSLNAGQGVNNLELQFRKSAVLGSLEDLSTGFTVYSSQDLLNIDLGETSFEMANINIYDLSGSKVFSLENQFFDQNRWSGEINLASNRVYILTIDNGNTFISKKFFK